MRNVADLIRTEREALFSVKAEEKVSLSMAQKAFAYLKSC